MFMLQLREKRVLLTSSLESTGQAAVTPAGPAQEFQPPAKASGSVYLGILVAHLWHLIGCSVLNDLQRALQASLTPGSSSGPQNTDGGSDYLFPSARERVQNSYIRPTREKLIHYMQWMLGAIRI